MRENLLSRLVKDIGMYYISDLHSPENYKKIYNALNKLGPDEYTLEEWKEATGYILGEKQKEFPTSDAVCEYLRCKLEKEIQKD